MTNPPSNQEPASPSSEAFVIEFKFEGISLSLQVEGLLHKHQLESLWRELQEMDRKVQRIYPELSPVQRLLYLLIHVAREREEYRQEREALFRALQRVMGQLDRWKDLLEQALQSKPGEP